MGFFSKDNTGNKKMKGPIKTRCPRVGLSFFSHFLRDYFINTSLHGLRYIAEDGRHWTERCIWVVLCSLAVAGALYTSSNIWTRYQTSPTMTVLQSTNFPIEYLPFPAITICNQNHVRWDKAFLFQETYLPDADNVTIDAFYRLVTALSNMNFGDFDMIGIYFGNNTEDAKRLDDLNVTFLMLQVIVSCEELFAEECWWRNSFYDCCSLFELQKSEYGFCYSFNSETSECRQQKSETPLKTCRGEGQSCKQKCSEDDPKCNKGDLRPRRTSTSGMWSGLRMKINTFPEYIPPRHEPDQSAGVLVFVTSPYDFPVAGTDVTSGSTADISLSAHVTYTTPQVLGLNANRRGCLYENESRSLGFPNYSHENCIAQCHRRSTLVYCNCTPYFYPTEGNLPVCDVSGLMCLSSFNDVFNYEKPEKDNPFFDDGQKGMVCECQADCDRTEYTSEFYVTQGRGSVVAEDQILLDIHFKNPTVVLYRTDVVFGWLDLTVSLGGIAGLFIGFSLLSGAELIYYFTLRLYGLWRTETPILAAPQTESPKLNPIRTTQKNVFNSRKLERMETSLQRIQRVLPQPYY